MDDYPGDAAHPFEMNGLKYYVNIRTGEAETFVSFAVERIPGTHQYRMKSNETMARVFYDDGTSVAAMIVMNAELARFDAAGGSHHELLSIPADNGIDLDLRFQQGIALVVALVSAALWLLWGFLR